MYSPTKPRKLLQAARDNMKDSDKEPLSCIFSGLFAQADAWEQREARIDLLEHLLRGEVSRRETELTELREALK